MLRVPWDEVQKRELVDTLSRRAQLLGPRRERDGVVRWGRAGAWDDLAVPAPLPLLPPKCWLLPNSELLWQEAGPGLAVPEEAEERILLGLAPCDLVGVAWLDRAAADDDGYRRRRRRLHLLGRRCAPAGHCCCPPLAALPPFDLFVDGRWLWSGSSWGEAVVAGFAGAMVAPEEEHPDVGTAGTAPPWPADLALRFSAGKKAPVWHATASRCLSCGACSAVCPTCHCFDVVDTAPLAGPAERLRVADNCFFREHGLVAGGHNFRPERSSRLQFRFEHKLLGFGALRGEVACVGCGRCLRACPARIDLREILAALAPVHGGV